MSKSLEQYPNSYDLIAVENKRKVLEKYLTDIEWIYKFTSMTVHEKKEEILDISLEIDQLENNEKTS